MKKKEYLQRKSCRVTAMALAILMSVSIFAQTLPKARAEESDASAEVVTVEVPAEQTEDEKQISETVSLVEEAPVEEVRTEEVEKVDEEPTGDNSPDTVGTAEDITEEAVDDTVDAQEEKNPEPVKQLLALKPTKPLGKTISASKEFNAKVTVNGKQPSEEESGKFKFNFEELMIPGDTLPWTSRGTATNTNGDISFGKQTYSTSKSEGTHWYCFYEDQTEIEGYTLDQTVFYLKLPVMINHGTDIEFYLGTPSVYKSTLSTDIFDLSGGPDVNKMTSISEQDMVFSNIAGHVHSFEYNADKNVLTATCKDLDGECPLSDDLTLTLTADNCTYDGTQHSASLSDTSEWETHVGDVPTIEYCAAGSTTAASEAPQNAGDYTASITFEGETAEVSFTVEKAEIVVSGITAKDKQYNGDNVAELDFSGLTLEGVIDGDDLSATASGTFADAQVGKDKTVTISSLELNGDSKGNYVLADNGQQVTATATITCKDLDAENEAHDWSDGKCTFCELECTHKDEEPDDYCDICGKLLGLPPADYKAVDDAVKKVPAKLDDYTADTVAALNEALDAVVRNLKSDKQADVDKYAEDIETALAGLRLKGEKNLISATAPATLYVGDKTQKVTAKIAKDGGNVTYTVTGSAVSVDSKGVITAAEAGNATITVTVSGNDKYAARSIDLPVTVSKRTQSVTAKNMTIADTDSGMKLKPIVSEVAVSGVPALLGKTAKPVFESGDESIVTVDEKGVITVKKSGKVTISMTLPGNDYYNEVTTPVKFTLTIKPLEVIEGEGGKYTVGSKKELTFRSNGVYDNFLGVQVDGKDVAEKNYTAWSGSTYVRFTTKYLDSLTTGKHKLTYVFRNGKCDTYFYIERPSGGSRKDNPDTADYTNIVVWVNLLLVSVMTVALIVIDRRKRGLSGTK